MKRILRAAKVLLVALFATLAVWLGLSQSAAAAPARPMPAATVGCDGHHHTAVLTYTTTERGPPVAYDRGTRHFAVDDWAHGASARSSAAATGTTTTYTTPTVFVPVARATDTTQARGQGDADALSSPQPWRAAANGAAAGTRALSYSAKIEGQMATRGWSQEAIQATVDNPSATHAVWDLTSGAKQAATAYVQRGGGYVVVSEESGAIVQISNLNKVGWKPVWEDPRFMR